MTIKLDYRTSFAAFITVLFLLFVVCAVYFGPISLAIPGSIFVFSIAWAFANDFF